jgi:hypothetical protein
MAPLSLRLVELDPDDLVLMLERWLCVDRCDVVTRLRGAFIVRIG